MTDVVTSEVLYWLPPNDKPLVEDLWYTGQTYSVLISIAGESTHGGYPVKITGKRENVRKLIKDQWGSNDTDQALEDFAYMRLGDKEAAARWNKGEYPSPEQEADAKLNWDEPWDQ